MVVGGGVVRASLELHLVLRKHKHVPRAVYRERLTICKACEHWRPKTKRCGICGCFAKLKLRWTTTQCPDKPPRWTRYEGGADGE